MLPLVLNLLVVAVICYNAVVLYKLAGELVINGDFNDDPVLCIFLAVLGLTQTLFSLYLLNHAMSLYEQLTVAPIY